MTTRDLNTLYSEDLQKLASSSQYLMSAKTQALSNFKRLGLPTKKLDSWKYSRIEKRLPEKVHLNRKVKATLAEDLILPGADLIVLINGNYSSEYSRYSDKLSYQYITEGKSTFDDLQVDSQDVFDNANLIMSEGTHTFTLENDETLEKPVQIIHLSEGEEKSTIVSRIHIQANPHSKGTFIEMHMGNGNNTDLYSTTFNLEAGSNLEHIKVGMNSAESTSVSKVSATLKRNSNFESFTLCLGGGLTRNHVKTNLVEEGAHTEVNGLYALRDEKKSDNYTEIHHNASNTTSGQLFKGILANKSRGVFTGRIFIHREAQQVDANQLNKNLLLSKEARIDTRPQLEVYADDVKCAHGATIGQLNEEELFYLQARGIPKQEAYEILMAAFSEDALMKVNDDGTKLWITSFLESHFDNLRKEG